MGLALPAPEELSSPRGQLSVQRPEDEKTTAFFYTREAEFLYKPGKNAKNSRANLGIVEECFLC